MPKPHEPRRRHSTFKERLEAMPEAHGLKPALTADDVRPRASRDCGEKIISERSINLALKYFFSNPVRRRNKAVCGTISGHYIAGYDQTTYEQVAKHQLTHTKR